MKRTNRSVSWSIVAALSMSFLCFACDEKSESNTCASDADCKNGSLCEGKMCIPEAVAVKARRPEPASEPAVADKAKAEDKAPDATADTPEEKPEIEAKLADVPEIPKGHSPPPKLADWKEAREVNTLKHAGEHAHKCSMKVVREWVRVHCHGEFLGYQELENFGKDKVSYYTSVHEKSLALVARMKQGPKQTMRICRKDDRASLLIHWPAGHDRPETLSLKEGPVCEGDDFLEAPAHDKKEGDDVATDEDAKTEPAAAAAQEASPKEDVAAGEQATPPAASPPAASPPAASPPADSK